MLWFAVCHDTRSNRWFISVFTQYAVFGVGKLLAWWLMLSACTSLWQCMNNIHCANFWCNKIFMLDSHVDSDRQLEILWFSMRERQKTLPPLAMSAACCELRWHAPPKAFYLSPQLHRQTACWFLCGTVMHSSVSLPWCSCGQLWTTKPSMIIATYRREATRGELWTAFLDVSVNECLKRQRTKLSCVYRTLWCWDFPVSHRSGGSYPTQITAYLPPPSAVRFWFDKLRKNNR